jgi:hypothetical protein
MTASLDGTIRNGRHHMQVRVYYEDTDFSALSYDDPAQGTRSCTLGYLFGPPLSHAGRS